MIMKMDLIGQARDMIMIFLTLKKRKQKNTAEKNEINSAIFEDFWNYQDGIADITDVKDSLDFTLARIIRHTSTDYR